MRLWTPAENFTIDGMGAASTGVLYVLSGSTTLSGAVDMTGDSQVGAADGATLTINGAISESGGANGLTFVQGANSGSTILGGTNTYTGGTTILSGTVAITNSGSLGTGDVVNDAEIDISDNLLLNNNFTINTAGTAFLVDGLTTIQGTVSLLSNLVINTPGSSNLYLNGVVSGSGFGITKNGSGTLGLGQANTYSGGTSVNGGFLQVFNGQATGDRRRGRGGTGRHADSIDHRLLSAVRWPLPVRWEHLSRPGVL